jgi:uncharacterized Zn finger protein (UPF0148 family)
MPPEDTVDPKHGHCPNCSAPLDLPMGETEVICDYCESRLKFVPATEELEVVRTREEMKYRERVAVRQAVLEKQLRQEETARWRETAAKVAIAAAPAVGGAVARAAFRTALGRAAGGGCGCLLGLLAAVAGVVLLLLRGLTG